MYKCNLNLTHSMKVVCSPEVMGTAACRWTTKNFDEKYRDHASANVEVAAKRANNEKEMDRQRNMGCTPTRHRHQSVRALGPENAWNIRQRNGSRAGDFRYELPVPAATRKGNDITSNTNQGSNLSRRLDWVDE